MSTIHSLPNELLEKIFVEGAYLPPSFAEDYPRQRRFSNIPVQHPLATSLSQVCRRWRNISHRLPSLWGFLHLSRSMETHRRLKDDLNKSLNWIPDHIKRSRDSPLHITLDCTRFTDLYPVLRLIQPHSERWRSLTILVSHVGSLPSVLARFTRISTPRLQSLTIVADIYRKGIISAGPLPGFLVGPTPALTMIRLEGVYLAWNERPLSGLTSLELCFATRWPPADKLRAFFDASPCLEQLVIYDDIEALLKNIDPRPFMATIELRHLKHLTVEAYRVPESADADVASFVQLFSFPRLETLSLRGLRISELVAVARIFKLLIYPGNFVPGENGEFVAEGLPMSHFAPFLKKLCVARLLQG